MHVSLNVTRLSIGVLGLKLTKLYFRCMTFHTPIESPCRVDKKCAVFKKVYWDFWPKKILKAALKYEFKAPFKNHDLGLKLVKSDRFWSKYNFPIYLLQNELVGDTFKWVLTVQYSF